MRMELQDKENGLPVEGWTDLEVVKKIIGGLTIVLWGYLLRTEILQFMSLEDKKKYLKSVWNLIDVMGFTLTIIIQVHTTFELDWITVKDLRIMASFATMMLLTNVYDWLRLFEPTAFFVQLIARTIYDIRWFMVLLFIAILIFGLPLSMVNLNRDDTNTVIEETFVWFLFDIIYSQYLLALGQTDTANFTKGP